MTEQRTPRIALCQTNPSLGNVHANLDDLRKRVFAEVGEADAVFFPELALTGYFLKDQTSDLSLGLDDPVIAELQALSKRIAIGVGFVERTRDGRYFNAYAYLEDGELRHVHRKVHLVSYGMFEESRDFAAGESFVAFETRLGRLGVLICEDMWHLPSTYLLFLQGVDTVVVPSAGPARGVQAGEPGLGSQRVWETLLTASSLFTQTWTLYVNRVGWEDGIGFGGGTMACDPAGRRVARLEGLEPGVCRVELDPSAVRRARIESPMLRDEKPWLLARELLRIRPELSGE